MPKGYKFSQSEAAEKIKFTWGYILRGTYTRKDEKVLVYCPAHDVEQMAFPNNLFLGGRIGCCGKENMRAHLRVIMKGAGNPFFGKIHSLPTREKISRTKLANPKEKTPAQLAFYERLRTLVGARRVPRTAAVRQKLSEHFKRRYEIFEYCARMAERNKTAGKPGIFYIVKIGDKLKFGSATTTMHYRLVRLRQKHDEQITVELQCIVPDAGAYEAAMMRAHRQHWIRGEFFNDFRLGEKHAA